ncbi:MAG: glyoxalase [Roseburia sp.]|nr:glyoxalase [Roseburia sp.]
MFQYDEICIRTFLEKQLQLFQEEVASSPEEADEFLSDCMAFVCGSLKEVREYFEEQGTDIAEMDDRDLLEAEEVFALPDGRFLIVEG